MQYRERELHAVGSRTRNVRTKFKIIRPHHGHVGHRRIAHRHRIGEMVADAKRGIVQLHVLGGRRMNIEFERIRIIVAQMAAI